MFAITPSTAHPTEARIAAVTGHRPTHHDIRWCRMLGTGPAFVGCLHAVEGHRQGTPGHLWSDFVREARLLRRYILSVIRPTCSERVSCERMVRIMAPRYGVPAQDAVNVMLCESGGNPHASNGGRFLGLYQHGVAWWADRAAAYGIPGASVFDGYSNAHVTFSMVRDGGWGPWECRP